MLRIYNSFSKKKEYFFPIDKNYINMYVCGVTVYDLCHLGHARTFIFFDIVNRYLNHLGYNVKYISNITDIDNKIFDRLDLIKRKDFFSFTEEMISEMHKDFDSLNIIRPNLEVRVTSQIKDIIYFIQRLIDRGFAYISDNKDVLFSTNFVKNYGLFSRQKIKKLRFNKKDLQSLSYKRNPLDFVLWKRSKSGDIISWNSPWGYGRPGWHIECSSIVQSNFGKKLDIHGGGIDLIFPHHENEIAQFNSFYNQNNQKESCANYWMHCGMLIYNSKKMSKSSKNFYTIREFLKFYNPEVIRYFFLLTHYRSLLVFSKENLGLACNGLKKLYLSLIDFKNFFRDTKSIYSNEKLLYFKKQFFDAIDDDFNTPKACSILFLLVKEINLFKKVDEEVSFQLSNQLRYLANILGLLYQDPKEFLKSIYFSSKTKISLDKIQDLIKKRNIARKKRLWDQADNIRDKLFNFGILLKDSKYRTDWYYK